MKIENRRLKYLKIFLTVFFMALAILATEGTIAKAAYRVKVIRLAQVQNIEAYYKNTKKIRLSWDKVKYAKSYEIFRCSTENGDFKKVKTVSSTSWTDSGRDGKEYFYRIRAKRGNSVGTFGDTVGTDYSDLVAYQSTYKKHTIDFDGIRNARDVGGYKTADGGVIKTKKILRMGKLADASDKDIDKLENKYHIKKDFDLRRVHKTISQPDKLITGAEYENLSLFGSDFHLSTSKLKVKKYKSSEEKFVKMAKYSKFVDHYTGMYHYIFTSKHSKKLLQQLFDEILDLKGESFIFHCSAGKDRTGVTGVLILAALGCDDETILKDFAISNITYIKGTVRKLNMAKSYGISADGRLAIQCSNGVSEKVMRQEIEQINEKYGSLYNYLVKYLKISENDIQTLREYYVDYD